MGRLCSLASSASAAEKVSATGPLNRAFYALCARPRPAGYRTASRIGVGACPLGRHRF